MSFSETSLPIYRTKTTVLLYHTPVSLASNKKNILRKGFLKVAVKAGTVNKKSVA